MSRRERVRYTARCASRWARALSNALGWRREVIGNLPRAGSLICPNHIGYVDILVLLAEVPCFFITRKEYLANAFSRFSIRAVMLPAVDRRQTRDIVKAFEEVRLLLESGGSVCVFLEGTSTAGDRVLPLKSPLLAVAEQANVPAVPVGLRWHGKDPNVDVHNQVAYWTDAHKFWPHFSTLLGLGELTVEIRLGEEIPARSLTRKELSKKLREDISRLSSLPPGELDPASSAAARLREAQAKAEPKSGPGA